jgi:hypothetical protein
MSCSASGNTSVHFYSGKLEKKIIVKAITSDLEVPVLRFGE